MGKGQPSFGDEGLLTGIGLFATGAVAFATAFRLFPATTVSDIALATSWLLYAAAFGCLLVALISQRPALTSIQILIGGVLVLAVAASVSFEILVGNPRYGTDALAFAHVGGELLLRGENPYSVVGGDLAPLVERFGVPVTSVTQTLTGDPIDRLIFYPALHVLYFASAIAFGMSDLRWAILAVELASLGVLWWGLSVRGRMLIPVVLLLEPNLMVFFTSGSVTDWLWVLPVIGTALALDRHRYLLAGALLGLACAVKQHPWFVVPFVAIWVAHHSAERTNDRGGKQDLWPLAQSGLFLGAVALAFLIPNLPFLFWSASDWLGGVLGPGFQALIPDGQGLSLLMGRGLVDLPRESYLFVTMAVLGILLIFYTLFIERLHGAL